MEKYIEDFTKAVYPNYTDLALCITTERKMITHATERINDLESELTTLRDRVMDLLRLLEEADTRISVNSNGTTDEDFRYKISKQLNSPTTKQKELDND